MQVPNQPYVNMMPAPQNYGYPLNDTGFRRGKFLLKFSFLLPLPHSESISK